MTRTNHHVISIFSVLVVTALSGHAFADTYSHIDRLANRIGNRAEQIVKQTKHYQHTPEYGHLLHDAQEMCRLANHIHDVAHQSGSIIHLQADVIELDAQFHHLNSLVENIEHNAAYGNGHIHGRTKRIRRLLDRIGDDIHHLAEDVNSMLGSSPVIYQRPSIIAPNPVFVPPAIPCFAAPRTYGGHGVGHGFYRGH